MDDGTFMMPVNAGFFNFCWVKNSERELRARAECPYMQHTRVPNRSERYGVLGRRWSV